MAADGGVYSPDDVQQGQLGDCYFESSLAAVANAQPTYLSQLAGVLTDDNGDVQVGADGYPLYRVTLFAPDPNAYGGRKAWHYITDLKFPMASNGYLQGDRPTVDPVNGKLKVGMALFEKAFAALEQQTKLEQSDGLGYYSIGEGGWPVDTLPLFVGTRAYNLPNSDALSQQLFGEAQPGNGVAVAFGTNWFTSPVTLPSGATYAPAGSDYLWTSADGHTTANIVGDHAYTFIRVDGAMATLRNPWGAFPMPPTATCNCPCKTSGPSFTKLPTVPCRSRCLARRKVITGARAADGSTKAARVLPNETA